MGVGFRTAPRPQRNLNLPLLVTDPRVNGSRGWHAPPALGKRPLEQERASPLAVSPCAAGRPLGGLAARLSTRRPEQACLRSITTQASHPPCLPLSAENPLTRRRGSRTTCGALPRCPRLRPREGRSPRCAELPRLLSLVAPRPPPFEPPPYSVCSSRKQKQPQQLTARTNPGPTRISPENTAGVPVRSASKASDTWLAKPQASRRPSAARGERETRLADPPLTGVTPAAGGAWGLQLAWWPLAATALR